MLSFLRLYQVYFLRSRNREIIDGMEDGDCIRSTFLGVGILANRPAPELLDCIRSTFLGVGIPIGRRIP